MKNRIIKKINITGQKKGFTLIELLVVISIVAVLAAIGITAFSQAQSTSRDGRRKGDIDSVAKALEGNFNASTGAYPAAVLDTWFASGSQPKDPATNANYTYNISSTNGYCVCATLEKASGNATASNCTGIGTTATGTNYCRQGQQQ